MSIATTIPKGALFTFTTGSYSSYTIEGVFRALVDIDPDKLVTDWIVAHPPKRSYNQIDEIEFFASILHMVEPVSCWEFHLDGDSTTGRITKIGD